MNPEVKKIKEALPHLGSNELIISLAESFDDAKQVHAMAQSNAGQSLSKELWSKCMEIVSQIRSSYSTCTDIELRTMSAALDVQMSLYEELTSSGFMVDMIKSELDKEISEAG